MNNLLIVIRILLIVFLVGCSSKLDYVGELVNDKPHGKGTITYENGDSYEGEWKEGLKEGKGTLNSPDGCKYSKFNTGLTPAIKHLFQLVKSMITNQERCVFFS